MKKIFTGIVAVCFAVISAWASQSVPSTGTDFWLTFMNNFGRSADNEDLKLEVIAVPATDGSISITCADGVVLTTSPISTGVPFVYQIPSDQRSKVYNTSSGVVSQTGLHVESTTEVVLYMRNAYVSSDLSVDISPVIATPALGTEYMVHTYYRDMTNTEFAVVATEDNTEISVTFNNNALNDAGDAFANGTTHTFSLQRGEACQFKGSNSGSPNYHNLTGTKIISTKPVALFNGGVKSSIPYNGGANGDHTMEQSLPVSAWGKRFVAMEMSGFPYRDTEEGHVESSSPTLYSVTAYYDNTEIYVNGTLTNTLSAGESTSYTGSGQITVGYDEVPKLIEASQPVIVYGYMTNAAANSYDYESISEPSMALVPEVSRGLSEADIHCSEDMTLHYANVVVPAAYASEMRLNGTDISSQFVTLSNTFSGSSDYYSYARISLSAGENKLSNASSSFVAVYYGTSVGTAISEACATVMNLASETPCTPVSGTCGAEGDNLTWVLDCDGVLTISGEGAMADYEEGLQPWSDLELWNQQHQQRVIIEEGITRIGDAAFSPSNIETVNLPHSLMQLGRYVFGPGSLSSIVIPENVISIDAEAFADCYYLDTIVVNSQNTTYDSRNNCNAIIETASNKLVIGGRLVNVPNTVTSIGAHAFDGRLLTSIILPNSITTIEESAFYGAALTSINIPESVTSIGDRAFSSCTSLTNITCEAVTPPTVGIDAFNGVSNTIPVYVPSESVGVYQSDEGWRSFTNIRAIDGNTTGGTSDTIRLYCRVTQAWWTTEDAAVGLYAYAEGDIANAAWPGARMSKVEGQEGLWVTDIDRSRYTSLIFTRVSGTGTIEDWGAKTADLLLPSDGMNLYTITSTEAVWGDPGVTGEWSYYDGTTGTGGVTITSYSLVGDSALFGGVNWDVTNEATNMTQTGDYTWTYTIASVYLKAYRNYEYKVVANHSWGVADYPSGSDNYILAVEQSGTYQVQFTFDSSTGCAATANLIQADESGSGTDYSNFAAVINKQRMVQFMFSGTDGGDISQYEAHVQLNAGDTVYIRDRAQNVMLEFSVEEYGAYGSFIYSYTGENYRKCPYVVCQVSGCYDLFYKSNYSLYLGEGTGGCSEGEPYDEGSMQTAHVSLYGDYGYVYINDNVSSGDFVLGSTITLSAQPYSNYQFLEWSDGNYANPRQFIVTGDTTISASFGSKAFYPTGILLNRKKFIRSTFNDGTQLIVRANIAQGDTVELYFINDNIFWMAPVEQYGAYQNFSGGEAEGRLICNVAGCYDIYFKLEDGLTQSIYIGEGTQCFSGEDWVSPIRITQDVCYLIGKNEFLGAWDLAQARPISKNGTTFTLPAGMYQFKLLPQNDSWENSYGYSYVYAPCSSANIATDGDGNIVIAVEEDTDVTISFGDNGICLTGNFTQANTGVHLTTGASPEEAGIVSVESGDYLLEQELTLQASISTGGWEFDKWSDDVTDNPRTVKLTQDTTIMAIFTPGEYGILINRRQLARGTFTGRIEGSYIAQFKSSVTLQQGDKIQLINLTHGTNSTWRPELEDGGLSANFSIHESDEQKHQSLVCNLSGCYDIYSKIHYGQSSDVLYISAGEDCQATEYFPIDLTDSVTCYSVVGTKDLFGTDWDVADTKTNMTLSPMGVYIYTLDSVTLLPDSIYQYKIIANHTWNVDEYPSIEGGDNYYISVQNAGVYSVTFTLTQGERGGAAINYLHAIQDEQPCGIIASGECGADGANVTWLLTCDSILTIGGDGRMADYNEETTIAPWYEYRDAYHSVYIAAGVLNAGDLAFRESPNLRYVDLASTVVSLGNYSFYNCPNLHSLTLPESVTTLSDNTPFGGTTTMTNPVLNSSVFVRLPENYAGEYTVAEGTTVIASHAFYGCNQLTSLVLPNTVHILSGSSVFENCTMLVSVNIPEGVTALGEFTFSNCSSLKAIDLPSTLASLGSYCFGDCWMIESITCRATTPPEANGSSLAGVNYMIPIYVPAGTAELYQAADGWSGFTDYRDIEIGGSSPSEAAPTPTYPEAQVKAIYSPTYDADCEFGEWASGTTYTQDTFGKKYETTEYGYFGLLFTSLNCSNMETLHFDFWVTENASLQIVPIWGGTEQGKTINLEADKWNSIDIPLSEYDTITDWLNIYQVKIANAPNLTLWIGNAYFFTTQTNPEDTNAPYDVSVSVASSSFFSINLQLSGTDDSGTVTYTILQGDTVLAAVSGDSGATILKKIDNLNSNTTYNLTIIASDESGNQAEAIPLMCATLPTPVPAKTPTMSPDNVLSLYSDIYPFAPASLVTYNAGWWEPPVMTISELAENDSALYYHPASSGLIGWEFTPINATDYPYFNIAIFPIASGTIDLGPIYGDGETLETKEYLIENYNLTGGQWNYITLYLSDKDLSSIWQATIRNYFGLEGFFVDNAYFSKSQTSSDYTCIVASGECGAEGSNLTWMLNCDSILTISGSGAMANYSVNSDGQAPWAEHGLEIRDIVIEEGVRTIGAYAFYNAGSYTNGAYNNVRSVTIPNTVTKLQNNYFYQCPIQTVTLNSDSIVGQTTYSSNASLHKMFGAQVRQYIIGDSVKSIASSVFYNQSADSLKSILLPEGLTSIGSWAFGYLENLDSITLPSGLLSIGSDAFYGSGLRAITIPGSVTEMGGQAFQNCDKLASVILEEGLKTLGTSAFQNCTSLTEITIPESMVTISSGAFTDCTHLTKMTILATEWVGADKSSSSTTKLAIGNYVRELILGDQIPTIGKYAFSSLDSLRTVTLPFNVTSISNYAFSSCPSLVCVISNALTPPTIQTNTFSRQDTLIVPCESKQLYKTAQYWQNFNRIRCADDQEMSISLTGSWTFIMIPSTFGMNAGDVVTEGEVQWGTYNGSLRAMGHSGWEDYSAEAVHMCSQALIARATGETATIRIAVPENATAMAETYVPLFPSASNLPQNANWCFTGNPYPYGYLLNGLAAQGITSPIAVWNGTGYDTYTPGIDDYIIPAFGAFFIQLPEGTTEQITIHFSAEYIYM